MPTTIGFDVYGTLVNPLAISDLVPNPARDIVAQDFIYLATPTWLYSSAREARR